jgi:hypothetical protein
MSKNEKPKYFYKNSSIVTIKISYGLVMKKNVKKMKAYNFYYFI